MTPEFPEPNARRPPVQACRTNSGCIIAPESTTLLQITENDDMTDRKPGKPQKTDKDKPRRPSLDEVWPVHSAGGWPQGLSLDRGEIFAGRS